MAVDKNDSTDRGLERIDPTPFEARTSIKSLIFGNVTSYGTSIYINFDGEIVRAASKNGRKRASQKR